ncbi:MAG: PrgI family protein [Tissierellia bacterium]|nr:PrgI family protein [Tissierellia bacterium]
MAFVPVPKDLKRVKTKIAFNLTKRQLICFSLGGLISIPVYLNTRDILGNELALLILIVLALPFFILGIFEKDGIPLEKYARYVIRQKFRYPKTRIYKTQNFYRYLEITDKKVNHGSQSTTKKTAKKITTE